MVEVGHRNGHRMEAVRQAGHLLGEGAPVQQTGEGVRRRLQLRLGHHPQKTDPRARQLGQRRQVLDLRILHLDQGLVGRMNDADGPTHDRHRDADG